MVLHTKTCKSQTDKGQVLVCFPRKTRPKDTKRSANGNSKKNNQRRGWWPRPPY